MLTWDKILSALCFTEYKEKEKKTSVVTLLCTIYVYLFFLKGLIIIIIHPSVLSVFLFWFIL